MATTPQTNTTLAQIAQVIRDNDDFVLCGHVSPDGDCLGSQLALWHTLRALGKRATCVLVRDEQTDDCLSFMPGIDEMVPAEQFGGACRVFVGLDVPIRERIGKAAGALLDASDVSVTVDHHASDTTMCDHVYVDPDAASASMLVWELSKLLMEAPPYETALCSYTGLVTDTGGFRFQNSDAASFRAASELVECGVDPAYVAKWAFQTRTAASMRLEAAAINRMQLIADGQAVISYVTRDDFERFGATKADADPLIDSIRSLQGVRVACMLRQQGDQVRGNLRSKDSTDVSVLARQLGGGGHKAAAGFTLEGSVEQAAQTVAAQIVDLFWQS